MANLLSYVLKHFRSHTADEKKLIIAIKAIVGTSPHNIKLYSLATLHSSTSDLDAKGFRPSNERLEYLGDAVLGAVVADYLFKRYPFKDEGFLTEIRSRIVNRETLNNLGKKLGLNVIIQFDSQKKGMYSHKSIYGDALEAIIGAVYLDKGYKYCRKFVINKLIEPNFNIDELIRTNTNYKSQLIEWAQKSNKNIIFESKEIQAEGNYREFEINVIVDKKVLATGYGPNKKKAEQSASRKLLESLNLAE
ncbi:MAG: ribonuclease III [Bacteroidota bacterium]